MNAHLQTLAALVVVALTLAAFAWRAWAKRRAPGCGGGCGCPADKLRR